jgi:hypothetical protein
MSLDWVNWSNSVAVWWLFLVTISVGNVGLWFLLHIAGARSDA